MFRFDRPALMCISAAAVVALAAAATAQSTFDAPQGEFVEHLIDSGVRANATDEPAVVFSTLVHHDQALWIRLHFSDVELARGSSVRITSMLDREVQELDGAGLAMWSNASAFFNGDTVLLELIAAPGSERNRIVTDRMMVAMSMPGHPINPCGICGQDTRVPSTEPWAGRLAPNGCTASIFNEQSCVVSAGHCMGGNNAVHFNVPPSLPNCNTQNPPVADQFPITSMQFQNGGVGADWAVMTLGTNSNGQTAYERYGEYRPLATSPAPVGVPVSVWGYGMNEVICTQNYAQQLSQGSINAVFSTYYRALIDVTFGNSGSALIRNGEIIGIVTHCATCGTGNIMTRIDVPAFQAAIANTCPSLPENNTCGGAIAVGNGQTPFSNVGATTTGPDEPGMCNFDGDTNVRADVWFSYTATCAGQVTFSLCDGQQPPDGGACAGYCGGQSPAGCWCDDACDGYNDCCPGVCDDCPNLPFCGGGPCDGYCGGTAPEGCWCDDLCDFYNDCCPGVCNDCPNLSHCLGAGGPPLAGFDTKMAIYNTCPSGSGEVIACNKDSCGLLSSITVSANAGQAFRIRIGGHNGATGEGILTVTCEPDPGPSCPADLTGNGSVGVPDLLELLSQWGTCPNPNDCPADLTGNGSVGVPDLLELLSQWGPCPE